MTMEAAQLPDLRQQYDVVDLTLTLDERFPAVGSWLPGFHHRVWNWFEEVRDGPQPLIARSYTDVTAPEPTAERPNVFYSCFMVLFEHTGTHFDAPTHVIPPADTGLPAANEHGLYGDQIDLKRLQGRACVIDVRSLAGQSAPGTSPLVQPEHVRRWESEHGDLTAGDAVLFCTGWDQLYVAYPEHTDYQDAFKNKNVPGWTAVSEPAMDYLYDRGIRLVGTESTSMGAVEDVYGVHYCGLGRGVLYVESLTGLAALPPRGSYFVFCPLKVARSSGCSGRAFAYVPR
jgi:isatin hydrolase